MQKKSEELTKTFQSLIQTKDKNGGEVLESLINLQSSIINKKNMVDQKTSKIESKSFLIKLDWAVINNTFEFSSKLNSIVTFPFQQFSCRSK